MDLLAFLKPALLIESPDVQDVGEIRIHARNELAVNILRILEDGESCLHPPFLGQCIEQGAVTLDVHDAAGHHESSVPFEEDLRSDALGPLLILGLGIGESEPDLADLTRGKEVMDEFNLGAEESHIGQPLFVAGLCTPPKAVALDVHTDEVPLWMAARQAHGVFALATAQLERDGVVVPKNFRVPLALVGVLGALHRFLEVRFEDVIHLGVFLPFPKFAFAHNR